ncbi:hypothetical protein Tco_0680626 [Tanacetum coccineum]|uniref:Uncharacterized protein n=1 Tax=Tanacetum coccineum TaxID=301880 RepID=A0ABQ4XL47_9ASTR
MMMMMAVCGWRLLWLWWREDKLASEGECIWGSGRSAHEEPFWSSPDMSAGKLFRRRRKVAGGGRWWPAELGKKGRVRKFSDVTQASEEVGEDSDHPTDPTQVPILDQLSISSKPKKKQPSKKTQRQEAEVSR